MLLIFASKLLQLSQPSPFSAKARRMRGTLSLLVRSLLARCARTNEWVSLECNSPLSLSLSLSLFLLAASLIFRCGFSVPCCSCCFLFFVFFLFCFFFLFCARFSLFVQGRLLALVLGGPADMGACVFCSCFFVAASCSF